MDDFEKHIRENKALFEVQKAEKEKLWNGIVKELNAAETKVLPLWKSPLLRVAASITLLFGLTMIIGLSVYNRDKYYAPEHVANLELQDIDAHYAGLVSQQVQLLMDYPELSTQDKKEFLSFLEELDDEHELLKLEMAKNLDNERVLEAIVANYKKRIELIEKLLKQINDAKATNDNYGYIL